MYEVFDHTADLGLRIFAPDLEALLAEAGRALFSVIVENPEDIRPDQELTFQIPGTDPVYLLFDWLNELLYTFETRHLLLTDFRVQLTPDGLSAAARGQRADPARHRLDHEVKAITYHDLEVKQADIGWEARVILDI